jgi:hypothetical protein
VYSRGSEFDKLVRVFGLAIYSQLRWYISLSDVPVGLVPEAVENSFTE